MNTGPGLRWVLWLGGAGFAAGFFGPLVFVPEANQGPLVGILISGPLGALLGLVLYGILALFRTSGRMQWRILLVTASLEVLTVLLWVQPSPARLGTIYVTEVASCASPIELEGSAVEYWERRIAEVTWAEPRADWRRDLHATLQQAPGIVVRVQTMRENSVFENRKPWNHGSLFATGWKERSGERVMYRPDASCDQWPRRREQIEFENYDLGGRIEPPNAWPPSGLESMIRASNFSPVPPRLERFLAGR